MNKNKDWVVVVVAIILALLVAKRVVLFALSVPFTPEIYRDLLFFLVFSSVIFFVIYVYSIHEADSKWFEKHQGAIVLLGFLLSLIGFFIQDVGHKNAQSVQTEVILKETNNRNNRELDEMISTLEEKAGDKILFRYFDFDTYWENWAYIQFNYAQECKNLYASLGDALFVLEEQNELRSLYWVEHKEINLMLDADLLEKASTTRSILHDVIRKCQVLL